MLPSIPAKIVRASALTGGEVTFVQTKGGIEVLLPRAQRSDTDTVIALELDQPASAIAPVTVVAVAK